jgi:hypothetical protein
VTLGVRFAPDEPIEIGHESRYFRRRRGYEPGPFHRQPTDEILYAAKLARHGTRVTAHKLTMHRSDQSAVKRAAALSPYLRDTESVRAEVVQCLLGIRIGNRIGSAHLQLMQEELIELGMRPFDLTAIHGLAPIEHVHE